jgi:hypothetical protein
MRREDEFVSSMEFFAGAWRAGMIFPSGAFSL